MLLRTVLVWLALSVHASAQCALDALQAFSPQQSAAYGRAVALQGDELAVATSNRVFLYRRAGHLWEYEQSLPMNFIGAGAIARDGERMVIGVPGANRAAHVFVRGTNGWVLEQSLSAPIAGLTFFGKSVDLQGDRLVVGGPRLPNAAGVMSGAALVYDRVGGLWTLTRTLEPANPAAGGEFGTRVSLDGERVAVGAFAGEVEVWREGAAGWAVEGILTGSISTGSDGFGWNEIDLDSNRLAVGASIAMGSGVVFLFEWESGAWTEQDILTPTSTSSWRRFGYCLDLQEDVLAVGAPQSPGALGPVSAGAAYVFDRTGAGWVERMRLQAPFPTPISYFGGGYESGETAVSLDGDVLVVGEPGYGWSSPAQHPAGRVHVFDVRACIGEPFCPASANSTGLAGQLVARGELLASANRCTLQAQRLPPGAFAMFLNSTGATQAPPVGTIQGIRCVAPPMGRYDGPNQVQAASLTGAVSLTLDLPATPSLTGPFAVVAGTQIHFQCWYRDRNPGPVSNYTNAVRVVFD